MQDDPPFAENRTERPILNPFDRQIVRKSSWYVLCLFYPRKMFQRDYISRVIEEMSLIPEKVMSLRSAGNVNKAWEAVNDFYATYPKFRSLIRSESPPAEILASFAPSDFRELEPLSAMLSEEAELELLQGEKEEAFQKWRKALELLEYVNEEDKANFSVSRTESIRLLRKRLSI